MTILLEAAIALTSASAGAAAGWCLRQTAYQKSQAHELNQLSSGEGQEKDAERSRQAAKELLTQVHGLTTKVASQVGEHNLRVQAINEQLNSADLQDLQAVTNAVTRLMEANAWMKQQLDSAESKLESQARLIEAHVNEARTDALTGIANRRAFDEEMQRCFDALRLEQVPSCMLMIDVDYFKKFNDTYGHNAGDEVLRQVARTLKRAAGPGGVVCRYGGEEFAIIFPGMKAQDAVPVAERCRAAIGELSIQHEGPPLQVNASAGLAEFASRDTLESVLERADEALYASKRAGRNCGHLHNGETFVPFVEPKTVAEDQAADCNSAQSTGTANSDSALLDPVTGLSSRDALRDDLQRRLASLQREPQPLSLLVVQLDRLATWQDRGGEEGKTNALRTVGIALRGVSREMDHAARFEEDSFAVALHGANLETAVEVAQRLRSSLSVARPKLAGRPTAITLSIGICEAQDGDDSARLFLRGQAAQNTSANMGGNQLATHDGKNIRLVEECVAK